ncbi:MAG: PAS domain-containing protein [Roseococcus sp.]|nr:PAS domain-containing protein [Roseococcus sp.]
MGAALLSWFEPSAFTPHGFCLLWDPGLIWLHLVSDVLIALSYFSIPLAIMAFVQRRRDFTYRGMAWLFAGFILFCGTTHLFSAWTLWYPHYWLEGALKAATAAISVATAVLLWPLIPKALALPSPAAMRAANVALEAQVLERTALVARLERREAELTELTATLERRIAQRTESLAAANRRFETALAASGVTVFTQDERLAYTYMSKDELGLKAEEFLGRTDQEVLPDPPLTALHAFKAHVLQSGQPARGEFQAGDNWFEVTCEPLPEGTGIICGAVEITGRKADEHRIRFLLHEVKHRVGNLLAVAQALLTQSAEDADSVPDLVERAGLRLQSLARSQQLLMREPEGGVTMGAVIHAQLTPFGGEGPQPFDVTGPQLQLDPSAVLHIGMAMHELATNAAKHGALSTPAGRVAIRWAVEDGTCHLTWRESGGPRVGPVRRKGFGSQVIEWAVAQAVQGQVALEFPPEGARWELRFPLPA